MSGGQRWTTGGNPRFLLCADEQGIAPHPIDPSMTSRLDGLPDLSATKVEYRRRRPVQRYRRASAAWHCLTGQSVHSSHDRPRLPSRHGSWWSWWRGDRVPRWRQRAPSASRSSRASPLCPHKRARVAPKTRTSSLSEISGVCRPKGVAGAVVQAAPILRARRQ